MCVCGGIISPLVGIGLTDLPKTGGAAAPLASSVFTDLELIAELQLGTRLE